MTNSWDDYTGILERDEDGGFIGKYTSDDSAILRAERIPAGFMRIKKEVLQKYIKTYPDDYFYLGEKKIYRFFWNELINNQFIGMDFGFSDKVKKLGYGLWVDPTCEIGHWGITEHKGNLDKYLREQKAITEVQAMAKEIEESHGHT